MRQLDTATHETSTLKGNSEEHICNSWMPPVCCSVCCSMLQCVLQCMLLRTLESVLQLIRVPYLIHTCAKTHSYVRHDSFIRVT